jgi:copper(I)-binding protein
MRAIVGGILLAAAAAAQAQVEARAAWVRATMQGQTTAGAYMQLTSRERVSLVGAESPAAGSVEIHEMKMEGKVMRMRALSRLELPQGKAVEMKPGGYHLMLLSLPRPLKKGQVVPIRLKIEMADKSLRTLEVRAEVRESAASEHRGH